MTVQKLFYNNKIVSLKEADRNNNELEKLVYTSMLCNDTKVGADNKLTGDPTETALVDMGFELDFNPNVFSEYERVKEVPFDSDRKLMTTVNKIGDKYIVYTKGGIDELLQRCTNYIINGEIKNNLEEYKKK